MQEHIFKVSDTRIRVSEDEVLRKGQQVPEVSVFIHFRIVSEMGLVEPSAINTSVSAKKLRRLAGQLPPPKNSFSNFAITARRIQKEILGHRLSGGNSRKLTAENSPLRRTLRYRPCTRRTRSTHSLEQIFFHHHRHTAGPVASVAKAVFDVTPDGVREVASRRAMTAHASTVPLTSPRSRGGALQGSLEGPTVTTAR
ncbi:hypothetical protein ACFV4N_16160 [Actinosynnema sp. NPDC059797]